MHNVSYFITAAILAHTIISQRARLALRRVAVQRQQRLRSRS